MIRYGFIKDEIQDTKLVRRAMLRCASNDQKPIPMDKTVRRAIDVLVLGEELSGAETASATLNQQIEHMAAELLQLADLAQHSKLAHLKAKGQLLCASAVSEQVRLTFCSALGIELRAAEAASAAAEAACVALRRKRERARQMVLRSLVVRLTCRELNRGWQALVAARHARGVGSIWARRVRAALNHWHSRGLSQCWRAWVVDYLR